MEACLEMFGDVEFKFTETAEGNPAVELQNVDTTNKPDVPIDLDEGLVDQLAEDLIEELKQRRFNARFPTKNIFISSRS